MRPFKLERYFARYEFTARYLLSASDCESVSLAELLGLADADSRAQWEALSLGYTESSGHPALRAEVARMYPGLTADDVLIAAPEEAIYLCLQARLRPGDHVIAIAPAYQSLHEIALAIGCEVSGWPVEAAGGAWRLDPARLAGLFRENTRLLIINFPHNPTGYLPARADFEAMLDAARQRNVHVFSDEMYRLLEYEPGSRLPPACTLFDRAITLSGLSKSFALPGLRIGWLATRDGDLLERCRLLKDYTTICASAPSEILALMALRARDVLLERNLAIVSANLKQADSFFAGRSALFDWLRPMAGSVAFPRWTGPGEIADVCRRLVERRGVMLAPGELFDSPGGHFRLGLGRRNFPAALAQFDAFLQEISDAGSD